ncbi:uncharacterized protein [Watersipora subatra]|uniref:uncharacterized protein n=1 Tax=Watersipora subatra TaxID=2589382 RepID=UPI00355ACEA5
MSLNTAPSRLSRVPITERYTNNSSNSAALSYWQDLFNNTKLSPPEYKYLFPDLNNVDSQAVKELLSNKLTRELSLLSETDWSGLNAVGLTAFWLKVLSEPRVPQLKQCKRLFVQRLIAQLAHTDLLSQIKEEVIESSRDSPDHGTELPSLDVSSSAAEEEGMTPASFGFAYDLVDNQTRDTLHISGKTAPMSLEPATNTVAPSFQLGTDLVPLSFEQRADPVLSSSGSSEVTDPASFNIEEVDVSVPLDSSRLSLSKIVNVEPAEVEKGDAPPQSEQVANLEQNCTTPFSCPNNDQREIAGRLLSSGDSGLSDSLLYQEDGKPLSVASEALDESFMWTETKDGTTSNFRCNSCPYTCGYKSRIKQHMRSVHSTLKPYKCHLCEHSTAVRASLTKHINAVHRKIKPYSCSLCSYTCSLKSSLEVHLSGFHSKQYRYTCPHCNYAASSRNVLDIHVQAVHLKAKPYKCPHCEYSSGYPQYIPKHIAAVHERQKPFACPHCPYRSSYKTYLQKHCDAVHRNIKPHSCPHCPYTTSYPQYLTTHISAVHNDEKPHKCPYCNFRCAYKQYINKHVELVHAGKNMDKMADIRVDGPNGEADASSTKDSSALSATLRSFSNHHLDCNRLSSGFGELAENAVSKASSHPALPNEVAVSQLGQSSPSYIDSQSVKSEPPRNVWPEMDNS